MISDLSSSTQYDIVIAAHNPAGLTESSYTFSTRPDNPGMNV